MKEIINNLNKINKEEITYDELITIIGDYKLSSEDLKKIYEYLDNNEINITTDLPSLSLNDFKIKEEYLDYLNESEKYESLSDKEKNKELIKAIKGDKTKVFYIYFPLILSIAIKYSNNDIDINDLIEEGIYNFFEIINNKDLETDRFKEVLIFNLKQTYKFYEEDKLQEKKLLNKLNKFKNLIDEGYLEEEIISELKISHEEFHDLQEMILNIK